MVLMPKGRKPIIIDIDTQNDFLLAGGKACIINHRRVLQRIRRVMAWARSENLIVISTCMIFPDDNNKYYIEGTDGQNKISYTLLNNRINFPANDSTDLPMDLLRHYRQVIFQKRCINPFKEPKIDRLLTELRGREFILLGASAEESVLATALGLLQQGSMVRVITDAVGTLDRREGNLALRKMDAKGARLIETKNLAGTSHLRGPGICHCQRCRRPAAVPEADRKEHYVVVSFASEVSITPGPGLWNPGPEDETEA